MFTFCKDNHHDPRLLEINSSATFSNSPSSSSTSTTARPNVYALIVLGIVLDTYLYSLTRQFFLSESVLVANPELGVSRTEGYVRYDSNYHLSEVMNVPCFLVQ